MAAPVSVKLEFIVRMTCESCVDAVSKVLQDEGVKVVAVDLGSERVVVETALPSERVKDIIESSGRQAVLQGLGSGKGETSHLGAAVAMLSGGESRGVVRMVQVDEDTCVVEGTVDGLTPGLNSLNIHELGDLSQGCDSCGDVFDGATNKNGSLLCHSVDAATPPVPTQESQDEEEELRMIRDSVISHMRDIPEHRWPLVQKEIMDILTNAAQQMPPPEAPPQASTTRAGGDPILPPSSQMDCDDDMKE